MCRRFSLDVSRLPDGEAYPGIRLPSSLLAEPGKKAYGLAYTKGGSLKAFLFTFGFPSFDGSLLYNARIETVEEKKTFQTDYRSHKAVFPATSFSEEDRYKKEHTFAPKESQVLYLAGFYSPRMDFVLLTEKGEGEVAYYHPRMPLTLKAEDVVSYLRGEDVLHRKRPLLLEENPDVLPLF